MRQQKASLQLQGQASSGRDWFRLQHGRGNSIQRGSTQGDPALGEAYVKSGGG